MKKAVWFLAGMLVIALGLLVISCGGGSTTTTPPATTTTFPKIPHTLEGRSDCVVCHKDGITAPKFSASPTNHATFTSATCTGCHSGAIPNAPKISDAHTTRTSTDCLTCHKDGITVPKFPADHADRKSADCQSCHTKG